MAWLIKWRVPLIGWLRNVLRDRCYAIEFLDTGSAVRGGRAPMFERQKSNPKKLTQIQTKISGVRCFLEARFRTLRFRSRHAREIQ